MSMAVLRSQDCLNVAYHLEAFGSRPQPTARPLRKSHHRASRAASTPLPFSPPKSRHIRPARSSPPLQAKPAAPATSNRKSVSPSKSGAGEQTRRPLVMEEVRILKRGEDLNAAVGHQPGAGGHDALFLMDPINPEPEIVRRKIHSVDVGSIYAGPAFFCSPSPSSLPLPGFTVKKFNSTPLFDEAKKTLLKALRLKHLA